MSIQDSRQTLFNMEMSILEWTENRYKHKIEIRFTFTKLQIYKLAVNIIGSYKTLLICIISNECMQSSTTYQREIELFRFPYKKISTGGHETNNDNKL